MILLPEGAHRRFNPLAGRWVLVSPHRTRRPWQGRTEALPPQARPAHDPGCYLCPGNVRANGTQNPAYASTFVFENDFAALMPADAAAGAASAGPGAPAQDPLFRAQPEAGICKVLCFSPRHDYTLSDLSQAEAREVIDAWADEYAHLSGLPWVQYVQIFENKGELMGCSNPHPHGQIWAQAHVPDEPAAETHCQAAYWNQHHNSLLADYLARELAAEPGPASRIVLQNDAFVVLVPFWAVWPFEALVIPRRHVADLLQLTPAERDALADALTRLSRAYDRLFDVSFPYSMGIHQRPTDGAPHPGWHLHLHFFPPLLRSATIKKFMVGYEMLAEPQRDLTPEQAAERLREAACA